MYTLNLEVPQKKKNLIEVFHMLKGNRNIPFHMLKGYRNIPVNFTNSFPNSFFERTNNSWSTAIASDPTFEPQGQLCFWKEWSLNSWFDSFWWNSPNVNFHESVYSCIYLYSKSIFSPMIVSTYYLSFVMHFRFLMCRQTISFIDPWFCFHPTNRPNVIVLGRDGQIDRAETHINRKT